MATVKEANTKQRTDTMTKINTTFTVTNTTTFKTTTVKGFVLNGILHVDGSALCSAQGSTAGNPDHEILPGDTNNHRDLQARYNGNRIQFVPVDRTPGRWSYMAVLDLQADRGVYHGTDWGWNRVQVSAAL
jgi:hypothetical protein